jgi:glycogen synthase
MRLLLTTDAVGGVWDYTATLARAIEREGHSLLLAVLGEPREDQVCLLPEGIALECRDHPLEWMRATEDDLAKAATWLAGLSRSWRADVVHLNQMAYTSLADFKAPVLVVVHSDVCSWFQEVLGTPAPQEWTTYVRAVRSGLEAASIVVAPTRYQADLVRKHFGRSVDRVIHNGADIPADRPQGSHGEPLILTSGRAWDPAKGIEILDRALGLLASPAPPAHLLGALEGPGSERFSAGRLVPHGHLPAADASRWMRDATIYVSPSLYEPFGLAPLEAALNGCALVLSDIGSFRELWDECALFFPKGNPRALADSLSCLLDEPGRVRELANRAAERARGMYSAERFTAEYLQLYTMVTRGGRGSRRAPAATN